MNRLIALEKELKGQKFGYQLPPRQIKKSPRKKIVQSFSQPVNYQVPGTVPVIKQPKSMACWATVTTMLSSWRENRSQSIEDTMAQFGQKYVDIFKNNTGLSAAEKAPFLATVGLVAEPPVNPSIQGWEDKLREFGPLWVTTDEQPGQGFSIHARIITGIQGDGTPNGTFLNIIDPDGGKQYREKFSVFQKKYEEEIATTGKIRIQIVHWPKDVKFAHPQWYGHSNNFNGSSMFSREVYTTFFNAGKKEEDENIKVLKEKISKLVKAKFENDYKRAFAHYADEDEKINESELRILLADADVGNIFTRGSWVDGIIERLDKDKDEKISWEEFQAVKK